ncbi:hypothetical protein BKH31_12720 [Actinomyces oris]|uniref:Uncharacterized protein n=1 Tax=Actinomyces oris TaxID=544580 RepID=A0A1Q8V4V6_9ACTO|nr:hypothetical protein BKH31_12720 [Actinomyces oris]
MEKPANHLAIQYVPASVLSQSTVEAVSGAPGAFLVMLPSDVSDDDEAVILSALAGMTRLNHRRDEAPARLRPVGEVFDAQGFWRPPARGTQRLWSPTPVAVPEVTRQRGEWTFEDAICPLDSSGVIASMPCPKVARATARWWPRYANVGLE